MQWRFFYSVPPQLQAMEHPIHDNVVAAIQHYDLLYMNAWIYNYTGLLDFC